MLVLILGLPGRDQKMNYAGLFEPYGDYKVLICVFSFTCTSFLPTPYTTPIYTCWTSTPPTNNLFATPLLCHFYTLPKYLMKVAALLRYDHPYLVLQSTYHFCTIASISSSLRTSTSKKLLRMGLKQDVQIPHSLEIRQDSRYVEGSWGHSGREPSGGELPGLLGSYKAYMGT